MELIVITSPGEVPDEQRIVNTLFSKGLARLHLRKPQYDKSRLRQWIEAIAPDYQRKLVIHSHYDLCKEYLLAGIHLTAVARENAGENLETLRRAYPLASLSTSFHNICEVRQNTFAYNYVFLSPIFASISKLGLRGAYLESELEILLSQVSLPVFALGGVSLGCLAKISALGFSGAAVLGSVWQSSDPVQTFCELYEESRNSPHSVDKDGVEKRFSTNP